MRIKLIIRRTVEELITIEHEDNAVDNADDLADHICNLMNEGKFDYPESVERELDCEEFEVEDVEEL